MSDEINEIKLLLEKITYEIKLGEERLENKATKLELNQLEQLITAKMYQILGQYENDTKDELDKLEDTDKDFDKRLTKLYLKIFGGSTILVVILEIILKVLS